VAKDVIMPALGMAQETGTLLQWLKAPGDSVAKGEPLMEVETDKATVEIEAPASGILSEVTAQPGDAIPVGRRIALILAPGETAPAPKPESLPASVTATPVAARMAAEHNLDLAQIKPQGGKVQKEDVLAYLAALTPHLPPPAPPPSPRPSDVERGEGWHAVPGRGVRASPKARRLAQERGLDLKAIRGSGLDGAVLAADLPSLSGRGAGGEGELPAGTEVLSVSRMWRVMAERVTQAWTTIPHFYLLREVNAARLIAWREEAQKRAHNLTYTDLLVKLTAAALRAHPRVNASWKDGGIALNPDINIGLAVAVDDGLIVPVIHRADQLGLSELAARRAELVAKAQAGKLPLADLSGGTFTLSNLGMYGVDAFNAIVNPPQAAILAVSRIADRVAPVNGQPAVQPMMTLSLSCDHRVVDGARGAQFLQMLAEQIEEPMRLLD
jgi:pyruvate dehydrogenase E2 component (dihydrolipoamide acetyltransferase)